MEERSAKDFAVLGGPPTFSEPRHVGRPSFPKKEQILDLIGAALDRRWVTNHGPLVQQLEAGLGEQLATQDVVTVSNGTVAIELVARALKLTGEVIVPGFTFVATAHAFRWLGLRPVFCDVDPKTHLIDVAQAERLITEKTSAIVGVHLWGEVCDVDRLESLCRKRGLRLIFDAAHAFGCDRSGKKVGNFGDAETFSFHGTKFFSTFEGGAIATNNKELAAELKRLRNFGFAGADNVVALGTNARLSEIAAAAGLVNLSSVGELMDLNRAKHRRYAELGGDIPGLSFYELNGTDRRNYQYVVAEVDEAAFGLSRDQVVTILQAEGVLVRRYFFPGLHRMEPYRSEQPDTKLPVTERLCERVIVLPASNAVTMPDVDAVTSLLRRIQRRAAALSKQVPRTIPPPAA
jgi:dTDP-4-amino-4,6-dideoxygalactose transaminase